MCLNLSKDVLWDEWNRRQHMKQFSLESYPEVKCFKEDFEFREYAIVSMITHALGTERDQHRKWSREKRRKSVQEIGSPDRKQKLWECTGTRLEKAGHYLKAKSTSLFLKKSDDDNLDCSSVWCRWATHMLSSRCSATKTLLQRSCPSFYCCDSATAHEAPPQGCSL